MDRDPKYFGLVLKYLREGHLKIKENADELKEEFEFFQIAVHDEFFVSLFDLLFILLITKD